MRTTIEVVEGLRPETVPCETLEVGVFFERHVWGGLKYEARLITSIDAEYQAVRYLAWKPGGRCEERSMTFGTLVLPVPVTIRVPKETL